MKVAVLGANWSPCAEPMDQTVVPATGLPSPSVQVKAVPPHAWTSIPRCRLYQACSAGASLAWKKMPPMPVTRFIEPRRSGGGEGECVFCGLTPKLSDGGHEARRLQPRRPAAVRCSAWLGRIKVELISLESTCPSPCSPACAHRGLPRKGA